MTEQTKTASRDENIKKIGEIIKDIDFTMMTTIDNEGELQSRPMSTQKTEFNGEVYFFTFDDTSKTDQISNNPRVNLAYADPDQQTYLSLKGTAEISKDRKKMEELWSPALRVWFPQGLETPGIILIKVRVDTAEYWDSPSSMISFAIAMVKSAVTGKSPDMGENETVEFN